MRCSAFNVCFDSNLRRYMAVREANAIDPEVLQAATAATAAAEAEAAALFADLEDVRGLVAARDAAVVDLQERVAVGQCRLTLNPKPYISNPKTL